MINPDVLRQWDEYERRNPGVAHPDRVKDRIRRGREAAAGDWLNGTDRFSHDEGLSFGERARLQRQRNGGM